MRPYAFTVVCLLALSPIFAFAAANSKESLSARIVIPSDSKLEHRLFDASLELTNNADKAVRVCTYVVIGRGVSKDDKFSSVLLTPENWQSNPPTAEEIAQTTVELAPGKSVRIPFRAMCKKPGKIELSAEYKVDVEKVPTGKNIWTGRLETKVKLDVTEESVRVLE
jgi:hypothetical protein